MPSNNNYSVLPDPKTVAASGIGPSFQDQLILGFSRTLDDSCVYCARATYRLLRSGVDDDCDIDAVLAKSDALSYNVIKASNPVSCWLIDPDKANTFTLVEKHTNGPQRNDHTRQLKLYGYDQITPQWLLSANLAMVTGCAPWQSL